MQTQKNASIDRGWLKFGLAGMAISVIATYIIYFINKDALMQYTGFLPLAILFLFSIVSAINTKHRQGGYISFNQSVLVSLKTFIVGLPIQMAVAAGLSPEELKPETFSFLNFLYVFVFFLMCAFIIFLLSSAIIRREAKP